MGKEIITFGDIEVEKHKFHQQKSPILIYDVNIVRIVVCNMLSFGKKDKYFIGYKDDSEKIMPLFIMLPKMSAYRRDFDATKYITVFLIKDNELLEKYNRILGNDYY